MAVKTGQADIQDDRIVGNARAGMPGIDAVADDIGREARRTQGDGELIGNRRLVFRNQDAHATPISPVRGGSP